MHVDKLPSRKYVVNGMILHVARLAFSSGTVTRGSGVS